MVSRFKHFIPAAIVAVLTSLSLWAAPVRPQMQITGYIISADLNPAAEQADCHRDRQSDGA